MPYVNAHGLMEFPCQRGALNPKVKHTKMCNDLDAPRDFSKHFPAGDKTSSPGAGKRSQERAGKKWNLFEPLKKDFVWRAGVCGDEKKGEQEHMRGGKFYHDGKIVADYKQGDVIDITVNLITHHNGFMELHLCDVEKCGGEISEDCFRDGHCYQLQRAPNKSCDSGKDMECGPIDPNYPGRWYLPCPQIPYTETKAHRYGGDKMQYLLPTDLSCDHCVLHWYWVAGNSCNPPGVREYFEAPDAPKWGNCRGQGGARGGFSRNHKDCEGDRFSEEYYQCADISIKSTGKVKNQSGSEEVSKTTDPAVETATPAVENVSESEKVSETDRTTAETDAPSVEITPTTTPTVEVVPTTTPVPQIETEPSISPLIALVPTPTLMAESMSSQGSAMKDKESSMMTSTGSLRGVSVIADGEVIVEQVEPNQEIDVGKYKKVALEAIKNDQEGPVEFFIDGKRVWIDHNSPFFLYGNRGSTPIYAKELPFNEEFELEISSSNDSMKVQMKLLN